MIPLRCVLFWGAEPEQQMKTFCSSVCVNNRFPGNGGSYGTAQKRKHAAQNGKFPSSLWCLPGRLQRQVAGISSASSITHELFMAQVLFHSASFMKLNNLIIGQIK